MLMFYGGFFLASLALSLLYVYIWHKHFNVNFTLLFMLIPIANMGYAMIANADVIEEAMAGMKFVYLGGCFAPFLILQSTLEICDIKISRFTRTMLLLICTGIYSTVLTMGNSELFYKDASFVKAEDGSGMLTEKVYGPMHTVFYIVVISFFLISIFGAVYSYFNKRDISRKLILLILIPELLTMCSYFGGHIISGSDAMIPVSYVFAQIMYIIIIHRICLYDITDSGIDSLVKTGDTGFISFDFKYRYLGSNETAKQMIPILRDLTVDKPMYKSPEFKARAEKWLDDFEYDETHNEVHYHKDDKSFLITINYLFDGRKRRGYQFFIKDDTANQQYISLINRYNLDLREEVEAKTKHIVEMHDNLVMSMATMVESRDNSTGGHIKRTSEGVRILINEMRKDEDLELTDEFCRNIIKAAPMHDLGKIAVDDAILRKPGRFTDEEYEIMKTHAAEGARIVHEILKDTDDDAFHIIAENVAHYHHERWDGSGYPQGLKGEQIPLEARIMAIADVYDALVSKRVYKEKMSFEKADSIIMEGMGTHFDKDLEPYYVRARPELEKYYSSLDD